MATSLDSTAQLYTLIVYFPLFFFGLIGNFLIFFVFRSLKLFRNHQCVFYLNIESLSNSILLIVVLPFRISDYGFSYDPQNFSIVWCKFRQCFVAFFSLLAFFSVCFAALDQYFSTNFSPHIRRWSSLSLAKRLTITIVFILCIYSIPFLIFFDVYPNIGCHIRNVNFLKFYSYVHFCLVNVVIPLTIPIFFATLAFLNVRRIVRRHIPIVRRRLDRQLTALVLTKVAFLALTTIPFVVVRFYVLNVSISSTDTFRFSIDRLVFTVTSSLYYVNSAVS